MKYLIFIIFIFSSEINYAQLVDNSDNLVPGEQYVLSAWVREGLTQQASTYTHSEVIINFSPSGLATLTPSGAVIDGWQRIQGSFIIPGDATNISIQLRATDENITCYFDDVRVFPFNGNMKSFVYDQDTQRLMAELDENNYATFYEYDQEGGLVRVKKETTRGVKTIQETRSGNAKNNN